MTSIFCPRQVEKNAIRRWAGQALSLVGRGVLFWLLLVTCGCLLIHLCAHLGLLGAVLCALVGYACYGFSVAIASACDRSHKPSWSELLGSLFSHAKDLGRVALIPTLVAALAFSLVAGVAALSHSLYRLGLPHGPGPIPTLPHLPPPADWGRVLFQIGEPFFYSIGEIGVVLPVFSSLGAMSLFVFPAILSFGVPRDHDVLVQYARLDGGRSTGKNEHSVLWLHALHLLLLCSLLLLNLAFLAPVVIAFLCGMTYVAYRDIYLGQSTNAKLETKASELVPALSPASA